MDTAQLMSMALPWLDHSGMRRAREVSRWHMDVPERAMYLFWFREELVVELREKAEHFQRRAAICEARAAEVSRWIGGGHDELPAAIWM